MARTFHVRGTRTYLYWALGLLVLGLWCAWEGWFPTERILQKHPPSAHVYFYVFNKTVAVLSCIGAAAAGYIHFIVK